MKVGRGFYVHLALLGFAVLAWILMLNPLARRRSPEGPPITVLEASYLGIGLAT